MAIDYLALKSEITTDPLTLGYAGKTNQQAADILNAVPGAPGTGQKINRDIVDAWEILEATSPGEWASLTAQEKQRYQTIVSVGKVNVKGPNVRASFLAMFGVGTATRTALAALQDRAASRAEFLGFDFIQPWDVARAKAS